MPLLKLYLDVEGAIITIAEEYSEGRWTVIGISGERERIFAELRQRAEQLKLRPASLVGAEHVVSVIDEEIAWMLLRRFDAADKETGKLVETAFQPIFSAIHVELFHRVGKNTCSGEIRLFLDKEGSYSGPWFWKDSVRWIEPVLTQH